MLRKNLLIAYRSCKRNPLATTLNLAGLSLGLLGVIVVSLYLYEELSYNHYYRNLDRIYLVESKLDFPDKGMVAASTGIPVGPALLSEIPEIENYCRFERVYRTTLLSYGDRNLTTRSICYADSSLAQVLSFKLLGGEAGHLLKDAQSCVISVSLAKQLFGTTAVVGKTFTYARAKTYRVDAVLEDTPSNVDFAYDLYLPMIEIYRDNLPDNPTFGTPQDLGSYFNMQCFTLIRLRPGADIGAVRAKEHLLSEKYYGWVLTTIHATGKYLFEPMTKIHFSQVDDVPNRCDVQYLWILGLVGLFLLLIAGVNYINLTTALAANRAREVGMRKVVGANKAQLIAQFLTESAMIALIALLLALAVAELLMPVFNSLLGKTLSLGMGIPWWWWAGMVGLSVLSGALAGLYPAFYLSAFRPASVLKGEATRGRRGRRVRQGLVVFQFALSVVMIIGILVVLQQINYMRHHPLGYDPAGLLEVYPPADDVSWTNFHAFKDDVSRISAVQSVGTIESSSIQLQSARGFTFLRDGQRTDEQFFYYHVGYKALETIGLRVVEGRTFTPEEFDSSVQNFLVNQAMVRKMGWSDPLGKMLQYSTGDANGPEEGHVIGVVADYNSQPLQDGVVPIVFVAGSDRECSNLIARVQLNGIADTLEKVRALWKQYYPGYPFNYSFVDRDLEQQYWNEKQLAKTFITFGILCVFIACLGLFGLITYTARQKTKEIGIRRSLGASTGSIVLLLSREFGILVLLANLIAWPVAWWWAQHFLSRYAYRIALPYWTFFAALGVSLLIAGLTVVFKALQAAKSSPAHALRYE